MLKEIQRSWEDCKENTRALVSDPEELWVFVIGVSLLVYFLAGCALSTEAPLPGEPDASAPQEAPMPREQELRPVGLVTDPNAYSEMPQGALSEAHNVVIRRKGLVEPRPGQALSVDITTVLDDVRRLIPYDGDVLAVTSDAIDNRASSHWLSDESNVQDEDGNSLLFEPLHISGVKARDNLYLNAADGVRKLTAAQDGVARLAGFSARVHLVPSSTSGSNIPNGENVAYRAIVRRRDANGVVVRSPPGPRVVFENDSGGATGVSLNVVSLAAAIEGDVIEVYRTKGFAGAPDAEYALVVEHEVTASDLSSGSFSEDDLVADGDRRAFLYTNPSQEGVAQENNRPHAAKGLALYRDSLFFLNTTGPHRMSFSWDEGGTTLAGSATGVGVRAVTGDLTSASADIQNVSDTTGLKVGMLIRPGNFDGSDPVYVTAINGSTVTVSSPASTTSAGESVTFVDTIKVQSSGGTQRFPNEFGTSLFLAIGDGDSTYDTNASEDLLPVSLNKPVYRASGFTAQDDQSITIEERIRGGDAFEIFATHGDEYFPPLPEPTEATGEFSTNDRRPSGFQWSKRDQPEHVPEANFALAGDDPILKAVPTKDAMFIFTEGGIWRLTGVGEESGWRIDPFDLSHRLLTPACAVVMQGDIYAWTNHGVVRVTDAGVSQSISAPISNLLSQIEREMATYSTDTPGAWMAANDKDDEILLGVPASTGDDASDKVYVFNAKTGAWTTWDGAYNHAVLDPSDGLLRFAKMDGTTLEVYTERGQTLLNTRGSEDDYDVSAADAAFSPIVSNVSSDNVVTLGGANGWTPEVGDMIHKAFFDPAVVIAVTSSTEFTVDSDEAQNYGTGAVDAYKHFDASVKYRSVDGGDPSTRKHYREAIVQWEELRGVHEWTMGWTSEISDTEVTQDVEYTRTRHATGPQPKRLFVPRDHGRVGRLRPKITVSQAGGQWQLAGLSLRFEPMSSRVRGSL